jgi:hypothetical protein
VDEDGEQAVDGIAELQQWLPVGSTGHSSHPLTFDRGKFACTH